tara:strand:- start:637 stop:1503 length:867 start_codon:yes stop_codon:yes gene_type:complete
MRKLKIIIMKIISPFRNLILFLYYISLFYEFSKGFESAKNNFKKIKSTENKDLSYLENNELIQFYLNSNHNGMTKFIHYLHQYKEYFEQLRNQKGKVKILEIGVFSGGSLQLYENFFGKDNVEIIGIDIDNDCINFENKNTNIEIGDQRDEQFLNKIINKYGSFDLILDDGGHLFEQQKVSFEILFPILEYGGIYIVEDISYRFISYACGLITEYNEFKIDRLKGISVSAVQQNIMKIEILPNCIVFKKYGIEDVPIKFRAPWKGIYWTKLAEQVYKHNNKGESPPIE